MTECARCGETTDHTDHWVQVSLRHGTDNDRDWPAIDMCPPCATAFKRDFLGGWKCPAVLMIAGADYRCDVTCVDADGAPALGHQGWAHANKEAQAVWGEPQ